MFLHLLNKEEQKTFIDLLNRLILSDGEKSEREIHYFERLRKDLDVSESSYKSSRKSVAQLMDYFAKKSVPIKKIVYLNLLFTSLNDDFYRIEEHKFMEQVQTKFELTEKDKRQVMKIIYEERDIRERAKRYISE